MSINFTGDSLSDVEIAGYAVSLRRYFGLDNLAIPDVVELLNRDKIFTRFGEKYFEYKIVPDVEIGGDEAVTLITTNHIRIRISETSYDRARSIDRRARFTIAHEFGHAVLHKNKIELARTQVGQVTRVVAPYVSVERQADVFASSFLMTEAMIDRVASAEELANSALVSSLAADIRWEKEQRRINQPKIRAGFAALHKELLAKDRPSEVYPMFVCPECSQASLTKIGIKYLCLSCNHTCDHPG